MHTRLSIVRIAMPLLLTALSSGATQAQDAEKIISQYVKAAGGRNALSKIQTISLEGTFAGSETAPGTFTFYVKTPNRYYSELIVDSKPIIEAYNGKSAWHQDSGGDASTLLGASSTELEAASQFYNSRLLDLKKAKIAVAYIGHAEVRGKDAMQVELTTVTGLKRELFFDPQSHLLVKESAPLDGVTEVRVYSDYQAENGVQ